MSFIRCTVLGSLSIFAAMVSGCSAESSGDEVTANVAVVGTATSALTTEAKSVSSINGTYGKSCSSHKAGEMWSASLNGGGLTYPAIKVRTHDNDCELTITEIVSNKKTFETSSPVRLGEKYPEASATFTEKKPPCKGLACFLWVPTEFPFTANAMIDSLEFAADFTITVLVSNPRNLETEQQYADYSLEDGVAVVGDVKAPDYKIAMNKLTTETDVNGVVIKAYGHAYLSKGTTEGQEYAIFEEALNPLAGIAAMEAKWNGATHKKLADLTDGQIPASEFNLEGKDVTPFPVLRTVVIQNKSNGVSSYELLFATFHEVK